MLPFFLQIQDKHQSSTQSSRKMRWRDIRNVLYINLDSRADRKEHIEAQLRALGLKGQRMPAIRHERGSVGCLLSHIRCLEIALQHKLDHILILEDDALFLQPAECVRQVDRFLATQGDRFDVLLLAGNNAAPYHPVNSTCVRINHCQAATAYLVRGAQYMAKLLQCFRETLRDPDTPCDIAWWKLQERDRWFLLQPLSVTQRHNYSDIENKQVDYDSEMLFLKYDALPPKKDDDVPQQPKRLVKMVCGR